MVASTTSSDKSSHPQEGIKRRKGLFFSPFSLHNFINGAITSPSLLRLKKSNRHFVADVILNPVIYKFLRVNKMADLVKRSELNIR